MRPFVRSFMFEDDGTVTVQWMDLDDDVRGSLVQTRALTIPDDAEPYATYVDEVRDGLAKLLAAVAQAWPKLEPMTPRMADDPGPYDNPDDR